MRRIQRFKTPGRNSMRYWYKLTPPYKVFWNFAVISLSRFIPFLSLKNFILRIFLGIQIGKGTSIGLMVMFDILRPELISIGDDSIIGYNATILCHEFLLREYRLGRVEIGSGVLIGANVTILPGVRVGDGAVISASSLVNSDIPPNSFAGGVPAKILKEVT